MKNIFLISQFFMNFSWAAHDRKTYKFHGSGTNCDDSEIEKYIIPGQTEANSVIDPIWKENVTLAILTIMYDQPKLEKYLLVKLN